MKSPKYLLFFILTLLVSCSGDTPNQSVNPQPQPAKQYVVLTSITRTSGNGYEYTESYSYDDQGRLNGVTINSNESGSPLRGRETIAFHHDEQGRLLEVSGGHSSFNDMVEPTDVRQVWTRTNEWEDGLVARINERSIEVWSVLGETRNRVERLDSSELTWQDAHLVRMKRTGGNYEVIYSYDYSTGIPVAIRSETTGVPEYTQVINIYADDSGRVVEIEKLWPNRDTSLKSVTHHFFYEQDGTGTIAETVLAYSGTQQETVHRFTYELVEAPGWGAYVLDPEKGLQMGSPTYFSYGSGYTAFSNMVFGR